MKLLLLLLFYEWGDNDPWAGWAQYAGNTWRVTKDHVDNYQSTRMVIYQQVGKSLRGWSGEPGGWNDMDMLETGNDHTRLSGGTQHAIHAAPVNRQPSRPHHALTTHDVAMACP